MSEGDRISWASSSDRGSLNLTRVLTCAHGHELWVAVPDGSQVGIEHVEFPCGCGMKPHDDGVRGMTMEDLAWDIYDRRN